MVTLVTGFQIAAADARPRTAILVAGDDEVLGPFDEIVAATGFRPDLSLRPSCGSISIRRWRRPRASPR